MAKIKKEESEEMRRAFKKYLVEIANEREKCPTRHQDFIDFIKRQIGRPVSNATISNLIKEYNVVNENGYYYVSPEERDKLIETPNYQELTLKIYSVRYNCSSLFHVDKNFSALVADALNSCFHRDCFQALAINDAVLCYYMDEEVAKDNQEEIVDGYVLSEKIIKEKIEDIFGIQPNF